MKFLVNCGTREKKGKFKVIGFYSFLKCLFSSMIIMLEHIRSRSAAHIQPDRNTCTIIITVIIVEWHNRIQAEVDADKRHAWWACVHQSSRVCEGRKKCDTSILHTATTTSPTFKIKSIKFEIMVSLHRHQATETGSPLAYSLTQSHHKGK